MKTNHTLFVCTTCASVWKDGKRVGKSGGQLLLNQLTELHQNWELAPEFSLQAVECMSACNSPCVVTFAAAGKFTYVFGNLPVDGSASAVLECASQYYAKTDGLLPWSERPEPLKKGIVAKIPPLPQ
ncbi:MAG TPA: FeS-binding protein [Cyanobacteria bacterium UBA11049]|nr:FeS-binding protein [Cyanobacteria bacterium UBA11049]